jgi:hypothetical protein
MAALIRSALLILARVGIRGISGSDGAARQFDRPDVHIAAPQDPVALVMHDPPQPRGKGGVVAQETQ